MLRKFAAAVLIAGLIAGPALAQGTTQTSANAPTTTGQPAVKIHTAKVTHEAKVGVRHTVKRHVTTQHVTTQHVAMHHVHKTKMHTAHAVKHIKHVTHARRLTKSHTAG